MTLSNHKPRVKIRDKGRDTLYLYYRDRLTGKEVSRAAGTNDRKQAERAAALWEKELLEQGNGSTISWEAFRRRFEAEHLPEQEPRTRSGYGTALNWFEEIIGHPRYLSDVTPSVLSQFRGKLTQKGKSSASVRSYLQHVQSALSWAKGIGLIAVAPKLKLPRVKHKKSKIRPVTHAEYLKIREHLAKESPSLARYVDLLWLSGMRNGEAWRLSWDAPPVRVDLDGGRHPRLDFSVSGHKGKRDELSPIAPDFAKWLRETPESERSGIVCQVVMGGVALGQREIGERITAAAKSLGFITESGRPITTKYFRQGFATRWAPKVRPITLQKMMRHRSIQTTLAFYVGIDCDDVGDELWK